MRRILLFAAVGTLIGFLAGPAAQAQEDPFEGYWQTLVAATKADNFQQIRKLIQTDATSAERAFFRAADHYVAWEVQGNLEGSKERRRIMEQLGNGFYIQYNNKDFTTYSQFLTRLNLIKKEKWGEAFGKYYDFVAAYAAIDGNKKASSSEIQAAIALAEEPNLLFEDLGDFYLQGMVLRYLGVLYSRVDDHDNAKRSFDFAKACFATIDTKEAIKWVEERQTQLATVVRNKEAEADRVREEEDEKGETTEVGETPWESVATTYKVDAKGLEPTAHPSTTDEYLLWPQVLVTSDPANFGDRYETIATMFAAYYHDVYGKWGSQVSLLYPFLFTMEKNKLALDLNDDGRTQPNERLKMTSKPKVFEFEGLSAKSGGTFDYAVEMVDIGQETWFGQTNTTFANEGQKAVGYRRACHLEGELNGKKFFLVDDNSNGAYNEFGVDSLYMKGADPCFLGKMMRLGDTIYEVRVPDLLGKEVKFRPYEGETGSIKVTWKGKVAPSFLFVRGIEGDVFNAVFALDTKSAIEVPVGKYKFYFGMVQSGKGRNVTSAEIREGRSKSFEVEAGGTAEIALGSPFEYAFKVTSGEDAYLIRGRDLELYGASGELYTRFFGQVILPKLQVKRQGGGMVAKGSMRLVEFEDRLRDFWSVWFPKDFEIDKSKAGRNAKFSAKFTASSKLLGSIKSDYVDAGR